MRCSPLLLSALSASCFLACGGSGSSSSASSADSALSANHVVTATEWGIIDAENQRDLDAPGLKTALASSDAPTVSRALLAVGRIGGESAIPTLITFFQSTSAAVRAQAAFAISVAGSDSTRPELTSVAEQALTPRFAVETDPAARTALYIALGHVGTAADLSFYEAGLTGTTAEADPDARIGAALGAAVYFQTVAAASAVVAPSAALTTALVDLAMGTTGTASLGAASGLLAGARALETIPGLTEDLVAQLAQQAHARYQAGDKESARCLVDAIGRIASPTALTTLTSMLTSGAFSPSIRAAAAAQLPQQGTSAAVLSALKTALADPAQSVVQAAISSVGQLGADAAPLATDLQAIVIAQRASNLALASSALTTLTQLDASLATPLVTAALADTTPSIYRDAAIYAAAYVAPKSLLPLANGTDLHEITYAVGALSYLTPAQITAAFGATGATDVLEPLFRKDLSLNDEFALGTVGYTASSFGFTDLVPAIAAEYPDFVDAAQGDARQAIITAIDGAKATTQLPLLQTLLHDSSREVALAAASAILDLTGQDVSAQATAQTAPSLATPSLDEINAATHAQVVLDTVRGKIVLSMLSAAPLTATQFVAAAKDGMYNGLPFHRVIPNFVAQGGDPHHDGTGHFNYLLRDEPTPAGHNVGYVGTATSGKDTASSQYFLDLGDNFWLDTSFTSFAFVTTGLDVAFDIQQGDLVTSATVVSR